MSTVHGTSGEVTHSVPDRGFHKSYSAETEIYLNLAHLYCKLVQFLRIYPTVGTTYFRYIKTVKKHGQMRSTYLFFTTLCIPVKICYFLFLFYSPFRPLFLLKTDCPQA
jgi:hypothetical protein